MKKSQKPQEGFNKILSEEMKNNKENKIEKRGILLLVATLMVVTSLMFITAVTPTGTDGLVYGVNETKSVTAGTEVNISGGVISTFNLTANMQNPRWKAFVGNVIGSFTLDDSSANTIYDWTLASVTGRIYATTKLTTPTWGSIACASTADLETENTAMSHSGANDNITATFSDVTHGLFFAAGIQINANQCTHTVNPYVGDVSTTAFEEVALWDGGNAVYAGLLEEDATGYDGTAYDFQMIVPENGANGFSGSTAYYLYVELD
ncbi:MAG: hypothetical protein PF542_02235 [Nanoarchaeota archaeon]|nr:hypothetical protein [Nanoarchaeota archaeon]